MMAEGFDSSKIEAAGWRQGAVLCKDVAKAAMQAAPPHVKCQEDDCCTNFMQRLICQI